LIIVSTLVGLSIFTVWAGYQTSIRSVRLANQFVREMAETGCMTEYDSKDYEIDYHVVTTSGIIICLWGSISNGIQGMTLYPQFSDIFIIAMTIGILPGFYYMFSPMFRTIELNMCSTELEEKAGENEEYDEYEDNEYLTTEFTKVIERMNLRDSISKKYNSEFHSIKGRYSKTNFANCRWANDYIEDEILYIDCRDISKEAAWRYGSAILARGSIRYHTELSFKKQTVFLFALIYGLIMWMVALLGAFLISKDFGLAVVIFTGVTFPLLWRIGRIQNVEARKEVPIAIQKTGVFKEHEMEFYIEKMFPMTSRFDWGFLTGHQSILLAIGILILWLV